MINPSAPKYQVLGVNNRENFNHYKNVYETLDVKYAIVNSLDGYDEISLTDDTFVATNHHEINITPADFGFEKIQPEKIFGGNTIEEAARIFVAILERKGSTEQCNVVTANAALGLHLVYPEKDLKTCVEMATESLKSGRALEKLKAVTS
jgi:anthranilate phosphoribosyltransferase